MSLKRGKDIPEEDHVVRYVPFSKQIIINDEVVGLYPHAFTLREVEKAGEKISVSWLEYFGSPAAVQLTKIKEALANGMNRGKLGANALLAIGNTGQIKSVCSAFEKPVRIAYSPSSSNPAHSTINHLPIDDMHPLFDALATEAFTELVAVSDIL